MQEQIEGLIKKAAEAQKSEDAMKFSQAACNAANAIATLAMVKAGKGSSPQGRCRR